MYRGQRLVFYGSSVTGFGTYALYLPDLDWEITIVAHTQRSSKYAILVLAYYLIDEMLAVPEIARHDWLKAWVSSYCKNISYMSTDSYSYNNGCARADKFWMMHRPFVSLCLVTADRKLVTSGNLLGLLPLQSISFLQHRQAKSSA